MNHYQKKVILKRIKKVFMNNYVKDSMKESDPQEQEARIINEIKQVAIQVT